MEYRRLGRSGFRVPELWPADARAVKRDVIAHAPARSAIVAGASSGIGRAVARRLSRDGFGVVVGYAGNATKAEEVVAEIAAAGGRGIAVRADVLLADTTRTRYQK